MSAALELAIASGVIGVWMLYLAWCIAKLADEVHELRAALEEAEREQQGPSA